MTARAFSFRKWLKDAGYRLSVVIFSARAAPWLITIGAGAISAVSRGFEVWVLDYAHLPAHAKALIPIFSGTIGMAFLLALTLYVREDRLFVRTGFRRAYPIRAYAAPHATCADRHLTAGVDEIRRIVRETPSSESCRLLLVSGFYYLGSPTLPGSACRLSDDIRVPGRVRVLLMNPYKEMCAQYWWAGQRANEADPTHVLTPDKYAQGIKEVCAHLAKLRDNDGLNIKIGFYNFWPSWQLFLNSREGIVQPVSVGIHAQYNPMYHFQHTQYSLFIPYQHYFESLWQRWSADREAHRAFYEKKGILRRRITA